MEPRQTQLRAAKRRQRQRDKRAGQALYQVKLAAEHCERLKAGMRKPEFVRKLCGFLDRELICVRDYPNLHLLCWNRDIVYMTREEAFRLYERNWRLLDHGAMPAHESTHFQELVDEFGGGLLNV